MGIEAEGRTYLVDPRPFPGINLLGLNSLETLSRSLEEDVEENKESRETLGRDIE